MQNDMKAGPGELDYRGRERYGMAIAVRGASGIVVLSGPTRVDAFAGETIRWTLVNATDRDLEFELTAVRAVGDEPADPFVEAPKTVAVKPNLLEEGKPELVARVLPPGTFAPGRIARYQYEIRIVDMADSGADPELDIYP